MLSIIDSQSCKQSVFCLQGNVNHIKNSKCGQAIGWKLSCKLLKAKTTLKLSYDLGDHANLIYIACQNMNKAGPGSRIGWQKYRWLC